MHHPLNRFEGIWLPLVTPFRDGAVDLAAARPLVRHYLDAGIHGLVVCGTTGEAATLSADEKLRWLDAVLDAADGRCPVAMGTGSSDTAASLRALAPLNARPLAGLLVTPPAYTRPSQAGIRAHLAALAQATPHAVILYNIPYRTGVNLDLDTVQSLCELPNVAAIKESGGNMNQLMDLIAQTRLAVLAGEDHLIFSTLCLGGRGAIAAAAHLRPHWHVAVYEAVRRGDWPYARALSAQLLPLVRLLFDEPNPAPIKALLAQQGLIAEALRLPMLPASETLRARLAQALARVPSCPPSALLL